LISTLIVVLGRRFSLVSECNLSRKPLSLLLSMPPRYPMPLLLIHPSSRNRRGQGPVQALTRPLGCARPPLLQRGRCQHPGRCQLPAALRRTCPFSARCRQPPSLHSSPNHIQRQHRSTCCSLMRAGLGRTGGSARPYIRRRMVVVWGQQRQRLQCCVARAIGRLLCSLRVTWALRTAPLRCHK
jgi:hypothetical protein